MNFQIQKTLNIVHFRMVFNRTRVTFSQTLEKGKNMAESTNYTYRL